MSGEPRPAKAAQLTRGLLSRRTGCNIETIRYYEGIGLMPMPPRSQGGHRRYDQGHLKRLTFIRRARASRRIPGRRSSDLRYHGHCLLG